MASENYLLSLPKYFKIILSFHMMIHPRIVCFIASLIFCLCRFNSIAKKVVILFGPKKGLRTHDNPCFQYIQERHNCNSFSSIYPVFIRNIDRSISENDSIERCLSKLKVK